MLENVLGEKEVAHCSKNGMLPTNLYHWRAYLAGGRWISRDDVVGGEMNSMVRVDFASLLSRDN